ncbi:helix-turn-helix domain-containing protein [Bacillus sp. LL01]|uniref:helix-turn-helix domain-containing protein n=1 Tax=Bacillus sp. LL01 TaxID=1665556 RepID=UPI00069DFFDA|nr:helix-turn-helix domain-containing protein [Bacillus sp. LL01]
MEPFRIGHTIKDLRKYYKISQKELADGVCTQAMISRIETDDLYPSAPILFQIAEKLGVDINYFFNLSETPRLDYAQEVCSQIRMLVRQTRYKEAMEMINLEKRNPLFRKGAFYQFLIWQEAICYFYITRDEEKSFTLLDEALRLKSTAKDHLSQHELEILTSKAIIYCDLENYDESIRIFEECLLMLKTMPANNISKLEIRILYNLARSFHLKQKYLKSIETSSKGINLCIKEESLYLLGELYYQKGESLYNLNEIKHARTCLEYSLWVFERTNNVTFYQYVQNEKDKMIDNIH